MSGDLVRVDGLPQQDQRSFLACLGKIFRVCISGIAGYQKGWQAGPPLSRGAKEFEAIHSRHCQIGDEQITLVQPDERCSAILRFVHPVPMVAKRIRQDRTNL